MIEAAKGQRISSTPSLASSNAQRDHPAGGMTDISTTGGGVKLIRRANKRSGLSLSDKSGQPADKQGRIHVRDADKLTFAEVHRLATSGQPVTLHAGLRDYRKPQRGNPLVALEDIGGLSTGQSSIPRLVGRVTQKARDMISRLKYIIQPERQAAHEPERSVGREAAR